MNVSLILGLCLAVAGDPKEDVKAGAKKLADQANYSWSSAVKNEGDGGGGSVRFTSGPMDGRTEKDGYTTFTTKAGENTLELASKGEKLAMKTAEGWKLSTDIPRPEQGRRNPGAFIVRRLQNAKRPAAEVVDLVDKVKELKAEADGLYSGELTEEGAKSLLSTGRGGAGGQAPTITGAKGTFKVWLKDGQVVKYEVSVQGKSTRGDRETAVNRTTTTEIKDAGSTKVEVADEAKKILG